MPIDFLEHGAHYAIGALAFIMIASGTGLHVREVVTGLIGVAFIVWAALLASIQYKETSGGFRQIKCYP